MDAVYHDTGIANLISPENFVRLQSIMYTKKMLKGSFLFWEGDPTGKLYYVRSGQVYLRKSTAEGKDLILSILHQGDLIGELDVNEESTHSFSAEIVEDAEIGTILEKDFDILLSRHGDFAVQFMRWMGLVQRTNQSKFRDLLLFGKPGALASTLIRLSNTHGVKCDEGIRLSLKITNTELADLIGSTRESVNRMLSSLNGTGIISMANGQITIHLIDGLREICHCPAFPPCPKEICRL